MRQIVTLAILLLTSINLLAQRYWQEKVDTIPGSGYYNIEISQEIAGLGLNSLLVLDTDNNEIPYLLRSSVPVKEMKQLEMYDLVSNTMKDSVNTIIVSNMGNEVSRFYIQMKEAEVAKYISIRGSYDRKQWFSVKQNSPLRSERNSSLGEIAIVDFPQGYYTFYELVITNNSSSPLNITGVGKIEKSSIYGQLVELRPGAYVVTEEEGNTVITFPSMKSPYYLSKLEMDVMGKGHYSREVVVEKDNRYLVNFQLTSRDEQTFFFNDIRIDRDVRIIIENRNNPSLTINDIKLFGLSRYLCAYLDSGVQYRIQTGADRHRRYDIQEFAEEIPLNLPVIKTSNLQEKVIVEPQREIAFYERPLFLWGVIILTGLVLLLICIRMLKELKKKDK